MSINRALSLVQTIIDWEIPKIWDEELGRNISYSYKYGSNGERDYMRDVAKRLKEELLSSYEFEQEK